MPLTEVKNSKIEIPKKFIEIALKSRCYFKSQSNFFIGGGICALVTSDFSIIDLSGPSFETICFYDFPIGLLDKSAVIELNSECAFISNHPLSYSYSPPFLWQKNFDGATKSPFMEHIFSIVSPESPVFFTEDGEITATSEFVAGYSKRENVIPKENAFSICFYAAGILLANRLGCIDKFILENDSLFFVKGNLVVKIPHNPNCNSFSASPLFDISTQDSNHASIFGIQTRDDMRFGVEISHNGDGNVVFATPASEFNGRTHANFPFFISMPFSRSINSFTKTSFLDIYIPENPFNPVGFKNGINWVWCVCS